MEETLSQRAFQGFKCLEFSTGVGFSRCGITLKDPIPYGDKSVAEEVLHRDFHRAETVMGRGMAGMDGMEPALAGGSRNIDIFPT
jgi:hypothetical protein